MKKIRVLLLLIFSASVLSAQNKVLPNQKTPVIEKSINSNWTFNYFPGEDEDKGYEASGFNDSRWPVVSLPHTWLLYETTGDLFPFINHRHDEQDSYWWKGWGWYRKHFTINNNFSNRKIFIECSGINEYFKIWMNGKLLDEGKNGQAPVFYDVTDLIKPGDNVLAVAVNNREGALKDPGKAGIYSGITGNVSVLLKNKIHFLMPLSGAHNQDNSGPQVTGKNGIVNITARVKNDLSVKKKIILQTSIRDAYGKVIEVIKTAAEIDPGQSYKFEQQGKPIKNLHIWTAEKPYAYQVKMEVLDGTETVDSWSMLSGLKFGDTSETRTDSEDWFLAGIGDAFKIQTSGREITENIPGEPAQIILVTGGGLKADRSSIVLVTAKVIDKNNKPVTYLNKTVKWSISGPGTLVGPSYYDSYSPGLINNKGIWGGEMPASNVVRSSGKAGTVRVYVTAAGLASGSIDIAAAAINQDNSVITEPVLDDDGRKPVVTNRMINSRLDEIPKEIMMASSDINFSGVDSKNFQSTIIDYIIKGNPAADTSSIEFRTLLKILLIHLNHNAGNISAFDYNFDVDNFNKSRLISGYINATKLPPFYKEGLRKYYSGILINEGNQKNAGDEMNWLNWIPSGGTVVISGETKSVQVPKGTIVTEQNDLEAIISVVHPVFSKYSEDARERAISFISKMNPYVHPDVNSRFIAEKGQPVLIPLLKFIAE